MKSALFVLFCTLATACASARVSENRLSGVPADGRVGTPILVMDTLEPVASDAKWLDEIKRGFEEEAEDLGIQGGQIPVEIRVTCCRPGSKALRYWIGFGAGTGSLAAKAGLLGHGELEIVGSVSFGLFGGDFDTVCEKAGRAVAQAIAEARGK